MWPMWWYAYLWVTTITNKYMRELPQLNKHVLNTPWSHIWDHSIKSNTIGFETISQIYSTRMIQMKIYLHIHGHKGQGHNMHEFWHKIWFVTQMQLTHAMLSKMTNLITVLMYMLRLLQCPNITQKWVFYSEIWAIKPVGPQMLYISCTTMESYNEAHQHKEHVS